MKLLWDWIDKKPWSEKNKYRMIILICTAAAAAAGLCVWSLVQLWALDHWSWMIVFTGYPAFLAVVLVIIYSFNHSFHDGSYKG